MSLGTSARAQRVPKAQRFQYRDGGESIPAASADEPTRTEFSSASARHYLDRGAALWAKQRDCFTCHTYGVYMFVRPALSPVWGNPPDESRAFLAAQSKSLRESDDRSGSAPTRMAYVAAGLAAWDEQFHDATSPETDAALRFALEMQAADGSIDSKRRWPPTEASTYHASTITAMATVAAPGWRAGVREGPLSTKLEKLERFLRETPPTNDHQGMLLLWTSTRLPNLLEPSRRQELVATIWRHQKSDGGWSIRTFSTPESWFGGKRGKNLAVDRDVVDPPSDGYQTGLALCVLRDAGVPADDPRIRKGVEWLLANQRESGRWWTRSLNTRSRFHFSTYSGSAYASLALAKCGALDSVTSVPSE